MNIINEFFGREKDPKKREVYNNMKKIGFNNEKLYTINDDYTVDLLYDTNILFAKKVTECPVVFNIAHGNFIWHYTNLKSMKNLPKIVKGNMSVSSNAITTLEDSPTMVVNGTFNCSLNKLKNLKGSPHKCGSMIANQCGLISLEGSPEEIKLDFSVASNKLTTLEGGPKSVGNIYDCSYNQLQNLIGICKSKRTYTQGNPFDEESVSHKSQKSQTKSSPKLFKAGDPITYIRSDSAYYKFKGVILYHDKYGYQIRFPKDINKSLKNDVILQDIKASYLIKRVGLEDPIIIPSPITNQFNIEDIVFYNNPDSKYSGFTGTIDSIDLEGNYKICFDFGDNPGIIDVVNDKNKNYTFVKISKIKGEFLEFFKKDPDEPKVKYKYGDRITFTGMNGHTSYSNYKGRVSYVRQSDGIIDIQLDNGESVFNVKPSKLKKIEPKSKPKSKEEKSFVVGDTVYYGKLKARVTLVNRPSSTHKVETYDIEFIDSGKREYWVYPDLLSKSNTPETVESDDSTNKSGKEKEFKVGDRVIYKIDNGTHKDFYNRSGVVNAVNITSKSTTYDVKFPKIGDQTYDRTIFFIKPSDIEIDNSLSENDKVIYKNEKDKELNGKFGTITKVDDGKYEITFDIDGVKTKVLDAKEENVLKFIKEPKDRAYVGDKAIYTKSDSKHYGCEGVIDKFDPETGKFEIEIAAKDKTKVRLKTKDENLDVLPPGKIFKRGDKVKYVDKKSKHDGVTGEIDLVTDKDHYTFTFRNDRNDLLWISTTPEHLIPLDDGFKEGDWVIYKNPDSKYDGRIGEFVSRRNDRQLTAKFDNGSTWLKLHVDNGMLFPYNGPKPTVTTTNYVTPRTSTYAPAATVTYNRKKKKREKPKPKPPVLVYNRRNVARRSSKPEPEPEPKEETME